MRLVGPLGTALVAGLAGILLVGVEQTWFTVAIAGCVVIGAAVAVVIAVARVVDAGPEGPRPAGGQGSI